MKVIAECGCNWHSIHEAITMIRRAWESGCWATKFQLFSKEYAKQNNLPLYLSLSYEDAKQLFEWKKQLGIEVFFTPFDTERVSWCEEIGVNYYKVRFKDRYNMDLLNRIQNTKKPFFRSIDDIDGNLKKEIINGVWKSRYELQLLCIPKYPASFDDYFKKMDRFYDGISDHTSDLKLLENTILLEKQPLETLHYFEKHVKLDDNCLESAWSVSFEDLAEVLRE